MTFRHLPIWFVLLSLQQPEAAQYITHGVAVGDVTATSAVIWSRAGGASVMQVSVQRAREAGGAVIQKELPVTAAHDFTGKVTIKGLTPDTAYQYGVSFSGGTGEQGKFRTAPVSTAAKAVTFAWSGDLGGGMCRDKEEGFPIFQAINRFPLNFFIGLGDMIYADFVCEEIGLYGNIQVPGNFPPAHDLASYWAHWRYNREDPGYRQLLARVPYYAIWDDHEVSNDFGPLHATSGVPPKPLLSMGLAAFLDYNPISEHPRTPKRLYRNFRWGKHLELLILDTRQYRDANFAPDDPKRPKTLLGREQLTWLKSKLVQSEATWTVIVSSVPMSIPTGPSFTVDLADNTATGVEKQLGHVEQSGGRDGWANFDQDTGFEQELIHILRFLQQHHIHNTVWITTDVHFAAGFRYTPFPDAPSFQVHEYTAGPLNALVVSNLSFDTTLGPKRLFLYGPREFTDVRTYEPVKPWLNFGMMQIVGAGNLTVTIHKVDGEVVYAEMLPPRR